MPVLLVLEFLHRVFDVLKGYFGGVTRKTITDNFSMTFQLLEEMLDNGFPMITEPNALNSLIAPPSMMQALAKTFTGKSSVSDTLGDGAMSVIPWRRSGVAYTANEILFDIMEEIDCIVERCVPQARRRLRLRDCGCSRPGRAALPRSPLPDPFLHPSRAPLPARPAAMAQWWPMTCGASSQPTAACLARQTSRCSLPTQPSLRTAASTPACATRALRTSAWCPLCPLMATFSS
jgi:hypothetical protein